MLKDVVAQHGNALLCTNVINSNRTTWLYAIDVQDTDYQVLIDKPLRSRCISLRELHAQYKILQVDVGGKRAY